MDRRANPRIESGDGDDGGAYILLKAMKMERDRDATERDYRGDPRRHRDPDLEPPGPAQRRHARDDQGIGGLFFGASRAADHARRDLARQRARVLRRCRAWIGRVCRVGQGTDAAPVQDAAELLRGHSPDAVMPAADHRPGPWRRVRRRLLVPAGLRRPLRCAGCAHECRLYPHRRRRL